MRPALRGTLLAVGSALAFGSTTPLVQLLVQRGAVGPFTTAAALYGGAAIVGLGSRSKREAPLHRADVGRIVAVAVSGAVIAPSLLAWGLARASGTAGSLMLNLEALFTIVLARVLYREHVGRRVAAAAFLLLVAGALLVLDRTRDAIAGASSLGLLAVAGAALAWAFDNALAKPLSARDPAAVVGAKAALGALLSVGIAVLVFGERLPGLAITGALLVVGATGYGASLRLYLRAQREIGAGRTASVFASGPFWGAALAWLLGEPAGPLVVLAAVTMTVGLVLHVTESHGHPHVHEPIEHEHAHRHDDGHHDHVHDVPPDGEHTHRHRHDRLVHDHEHLPDLHHDHGHEH